MKTSTNPAAIRRCLLAEYWRRYPITAVAILTLVAAPTMRAFDATPYPGPNPPDGTATYPWKINLPDDFDMIGTDGIHLSNQHYRLMSDLDFGNQDHRVRVDFTGTLDGGYHVISKIRVDQPAETGVALFKATWQGGVVRCLGIVDSYFRAHSTAAPFVGALQLGSRVEKCFSLRNEIIAVTNQSAGGIVGGGSYQSPSAVVSNSFARDNSVNCAAHQTVGGISGYHDARVEYCYSAGNTLTAPRYVGGVVGYGIGTGSIFHSYSDRTNSPSTQVGYFSGGWQNALVPDRYSGGFDITQYSIAQLNWDPAVWTKGPDSYPRLLGFNQEPVANAGTDQMIQLGASAHLDGVGTVDDRTALQDLVFAWTVESAPAGSAAVLIGADTPTPVLVPDRAGEFRIKLTVTDAAGLTDADETLVTASAVIANGSFEEGFAGWNNSGNVSLQSGPPYVPRDGSILVSFNDGNRPPNGVISQVLPTIPGQSYRLEFDAGVLAYNMNDQRLGVTVQGNGQLLSDTITLTGLGGGRVLWVPKSYVFTADSATTTLTFRDLSPVTFSIDLLLDNVRVAPLVTTLLVTSIPANGVGVVVSPPDTLGAGDGGTSFRRFYNPGAVVDLTAPVEAAGGTFFNWLRDGAHYSTDPEVQVTMDGDHQMTAVYWTGDPMITVQPVGMTAVEGGAAVFSVTASGAVPLSYQWRFNGTDIPGAEAREFTISHVEAADAGDYDVVVSNSLGSVTSDTAVLSIQSGFVGLENGSFESDFQGWTVSGNVWIQSSHPYYPTDGIKLAAFNAGNTTPNAVLSQSFTTTPGQHYFLSFDMGVLSFNTSPQRLEVEVAGSPSLLLQTFPITGIADGKCHWLTQNLAFTADSPRTTLTFRDRSAGSNAIDLLLDHVVITPRIMRTLVVESGPGFFTQESVEVSPPDDNGDANGQLLYFVRHYLDGTLVNLTAPEIAHFYGPGHADVFIFQKWQRDGVDYDTSRATRVSMDADCRLFAVYAPSPPIITEQPSDVVAGVGGIATFRVGVQVQSVSEILTYQWRFNGTAIPGAIASNYSITNVSAADDGIYDVVVTNQVGPTTSTAARLTVVPVSLVNGSFESGFDGWSHSGNVRVQSAATVPDGTKVLGFNTGNSSTGGVVSQTFTTIPGLTYRLTFDMGVLAYNTSEQRLQVNVSGGATLANQVFSMNGTGGGRTIWATKTVGFTTDSPTTTVTFTDRSPTSNAIDLLLDHVRLEPVSFTVTTLADENDGALGRGTGDSLREAIAAAAASPGVELIRFAPVLNGGTITLGGTQLTVDTDVMIDASSLPAGITISGNDSSRVFEIKSGCTVSMAGLIITRGGVWLVSGCGIFNSGTLSLREMTIAGNHTSGDLATYPKGAGIYNEGILRMDSCTATGNSVGNGSGGALYNSGTAVLVNCTLSGNLAVYRGAGILNDGTITVRHCTISDNEDYYAGGSGIHNTADLTLENSIIAGNRTSNPGVPNDLDGVVTTSLGVNLIGGDPILAPLGNHGGRTQTMPPMAGSPAIDAATWLGTTPSTDQRRLPRPLGAAPDIGAVEISQLLVTTTVDESDAGLGIGAGDSLREVLAAASSGPGTKLVSFVSALDGGVITLGGTQLTVSTDVMIDASSLPAGITVSGNDLSRVFEIKAGHTVAMAGFTVTRGYIFVQEAGPIYMVGGGLLNSGTLSLEQVTVVDNHGRAIDRRVTSVDGGGIYNDGVLVMNRSTVMGNSVSGGGDLVLRGGGIANDGDATLVNSTVSGNYGNFSGGGVWNNGTMIVRHCTISDNRTGYFVGSGIDNTDLLTLENSIIAGNRTDMGIPGDLKGVVTTSLGANLIGGNPMLAPLGNYGGRTQTMPPLAGSPAINAAVWLGTTPAIDQRGNPRPQASPDIGSVEYIP